MGGVGGVYFLASPGELIVHVMKWDRHLFSRHTELRAILVGPDRTVLEEKTIPDDGQPPGSGLGAPQHVLLRAEVARPGVYGLNVTVSQDRYGEEIAWGFRTNSRHYLIETSRGHRDDDHEEPIVLLNAGNPANVCFMPRRGEFTFEVTDVPASSGSVSLYSSDGGLIHVAPIGPDGRALGKIAAETPRDGRPWRLHIPRQPAVIHVDGVTRWDSGDDHPHLCYWTPDSASWFPLLEYRWLLAPYRRTVYAPSGSRGFTNFVVHNNSNCERIIELTLEYPETPWPVKLAQDRVVVGPKSSTEVSVEYRTPQSGRARTCHLRATPVASPNFSTYSTLTVVAGSAPATKFLPIPLFLRPYEHENEQFGYIPDYPVESEPYFGLDNSPVVRTPLGLSVLRKTDWVTTDLKEAVRSKMPSFEGDALSRPSTKVAFDSDGDLYALATSGPHGVLLHSADAGKTFAAYLIPAKRHRGVAYDIEQFSGHNLPDGPPPILRYTRTASDSQLRWRMIHDLELIVPEKRDGAIFIGEPILLSKQCIGLCSHSGIPASIVSHGSKVHVVWAEATDAAAQVPGVPTFVATYDRGTKRLGQAMLVGYGAPPNDIHNSPSITIDSGGYLHVLAGTHGRPFQYARSLVPNEAGKQWTAAEPVGEGLGQTYIGLVCGPNDTLHLVCRLWRSGVEPFPRSSHATLAYFRKRPGRQWEPPHILVVAPFSEYSIFYHRLTIDRIGRLFLSYDYWSTYWFYRMDHYGSRRALVMSSDGGDRWKLVSAADFRRGITGAR